MTRGVEILRPHPVTDGKLRLDLNGPVARSATGQHPLDHVRFQNALRRATLFQMMPRCQLLGSGKTMPLKEHVDTPDPDLVIARCQIAGRRNILPRMPALVDRPGTECSAGQRDAERPLLPFRMKVWFVFLRRDRTEAHLPTKIMWPIHARTSDDNGRPVPIIESRVTSLASASSSSPSVPAGRRGTTR